MQVTNIVEYEAQIDSHEEQEAIKEALALVPELWLETLSLEEAVEVKKLKIEQDIKELERQRDLLDLL